MVSADVKFLGAIVEGEESEHTSEFDGVMRLKAALQEAGITNASVKQESYNEKDHQSDCSIECLGSQNLILGRIIAMVCHVLLSTRSHSHRLRKVQILDARPLSGNARPPSGNA